MNVNDALTKAFGGNKHGVADLPGLIARLHDWYFRWPDGNYLHPCIIESRPALVCQAELSRLEPTAFAELQAITEQFGLYLKQDGRCQDQAHEGRNRRHGTAFVLAFCLSLLAVSKTVSAHELQAANTHAVALNPAEVPVGSMQATAIITGDGAKTVRLQRVRPPTAEQVLQAYQTQVKRLPRDRQLETDVGDFLRRAYQAQSDDPANIEADLQTMAEYYAGFPQAVELIQALSERKVVLKYRAASWQAQAWGSRHRVDSVTVYFDTRVGAQLLNVSGCEANPACSISAADALLHELLHAKLMLLDSQHFIEEGGMQTTLYPFSHEHEVLMLENQLYQAMNRVDGRARPMRQHHSGSLHQVACSLCTPGLQTAALDTD